jgi:TonB family protein
MPRNEPDAGPRLLLEDYGKASQRWLAAFAAARDIYKRSSPALPGSSDTEIRLLNDPGRTQRWLERFARQQADFGPYGGPPPNLPPREAPDLHLLLEDYGPGPRFVQELRKRVGRNGSRGAGDPGGASPRAGAAATQEAVPARQAGVPSRRAGAPESRVPEPQARLPVPRADDLDLQLERNWEDPAADSQRRRSRLSSLTAHALLLAILLLVHHAGPPPLPNEQAMHNLDTVSLVAPSAAELAELTQRPQEPKEFTKLDERPNEPARPAVVAPPQPAPPRPVIQVPDPPAIEPKPTPPAPEPKLEVERPPEPEPSEARSPAPGLIQQGENRPRLRPDELPVLNAPKKVDSKLEVAQATATGPGRDGELQLGNVRLNARPDEVIQAAIDNLAAGGGTQIVGDGYNATGIGAALPPSPGNRSSTLELLSDPKGVDFRPYLIQVLAAVRRNWYAVIPESARLGMSRGRVAIQFIISRDGSVPKLVIADSANMKALDHAAVAGISASVPFQSLPLEYTGKEIRLQFVFLYNVKR